MELMSLVKYSEYNRKEVHDLFVPGKEYKPWAGAWGSSGLVRLPTSKSDFVFFVTFGTEISGHRFDEGITRDGVLSWQSQPAQSLSTPRIQQLIRHDEDKNDIFLLLRTEKVRDYTYLGRLKYLLHDSAREKPVYFQWQILEWDLPDAVREEMGLVLDEPTTEPPIGQSSGQVSPPQRSDGQGRAVPTGEFQAVKGKDWGAQEAANSALGLAGEKFVVAQEKAKLRAAGRNDLADQVQHVSVEVGDGLGYDVLSFDSLGGKRLIEVKTTSGPSTTDFFVTERERAVSEKSASQYELHRVFNFDLAASTGQFFVIEGSLNANFSLKATQYRAKR